MKGRHWYCAFLFPCGLLFSGCETYMWQSVPAQAQVSNDYFDADITPVCNSEGCQAFRLRLLNKTDRNIEVNWNKTLYIAASQTSGGFMFEGLMYMDRNNPKLPDIVFAHSLLSKTIWPSNLVYFYDYVRGGGQWSHHSMGAGENGVYLSVTVDGKEITERLTLDLVAMRIQ